LQSGRPLDKGRHFMIKRIRSKTNRNKVNKSVTERHLKVLEFVLIKDLS